MDSSVNQGETFEVSTPQPDDIEKASVWSDFGNGYGYVPLVLPFFGLWWLWRVSRQA